MLKSPTDHLQRLKVRPPDAGRNTVPDTPFKGQDDVSLPQWRGRSTLEGIVLGQQAVAEGPRPARERRTGSLTFHCPAFALYADCTSPPAAGSRTSQSPVVDASQASQPLHVGCQWSRSVMRMRNHPQAATLNCYSAHDTIC